MIVRPNPKQANVEDAIVSEPQSGEFKIKKLRLASNAEEIVVTHSSAAEA